ncbi:DNA mismatch repair protein MutS [Cryomorpha ignava]|uniref:DNA mismatch repair protein MutS n=1 Tax=Cryomorpha ignava TaxID=101383 RepID=A0A7K3WRC1_9FLAO|nr:DNA mismatch repair protein MutS [Cryomorpha ignava]NEN24024.1 DNA mismatch repair protein MutS [Cryomorpha ignava]
MKQYLGIKAKYPDALLLFRVGDFYETFGQDAIKTSNVLGIVLAKRKNGAAAHIELAGFPHHSLDMYLPKLVRAGYRVAICDQLEDPKLTKTIVKRGVTELVTPGVAFNDQVLDHKSNNFLAAVYFQNDKAGLALLDISTGEFLTAEGTMPYIEKLMQSFKPSEVLFQRNFEERFLNVFGGKFHTFRLDDWVFTEEFAYDKLLGHFKTKSLKGFGVDNMSLGVVACGAVLQYLDDTHHEKLGHVSRLRRIEEDNHVWLDRFTIRNLELISSSSDGGTSLLQIIDRTISPMGSRLMKRWLVLPLKTKKAIDQRLEAVSYFIENEKVSNHIAAQIEQIGDVERLISKVSVGRINPREVLQLGRALKAMGPIQETLSKTGNDTLHHIAEQLNPCKSILDRISTEINEDAPVQIAKSGVIANGVNEELDDLRSIKTSGKERLLEIQKREVERTGITSLKIAFNNVFGYYLEVRNTHKDKVPEDWSRKQTLVNAERYITEELKVYEEKILGAEERIFNLESRIFNDLVISMGGFVEPIQLNARRIGQLDCLLSFSRVARELNYVRPEINEGFVLDIKDGRHPVIEHQLPIGESYVANDVYLDKTTQQIMMITGPNMAGKSALLRQTALIVIMAQMGSYVPASEAKIGLIDKVFTRVGASDNISSGESTFMVEMNETASILNNLSDRSLVLLDEIGRGTSTYDGISIAWAITEYIHENKTSKAKTLFATHYHELNEMQALFKRVKNFNVSVKEIKDKVIFLRKLKAGGSEHSFGIHVAQMAGMPPFVVSRATEIMTRLEKTHSSETFDPGRKKSKDDSMQLSFFKLDDPVLEQIRDEIAGMDINSLTPVEALMKLNEIKKLTGK